MATAIVETNLASRGIFQKRGVGPSLQSCIIQCITSEEEMYPVLRYDSLYPEHTRTQQTHLETDIWLDDAESSVSSIGLHSDGEVPPATLNVSQSTDKYIEVKAYGGRLGPPTREHTALLAVEALTRQLIGLRPISCNTCNLQNSSPQFQHYGVSLDDNEKEQLGLCSFFPRALYCIPPLWLVLLHAETESDLLNIEHISSENSWKKLRELHAHFYSCSSGATRTTSATDKHGAAAPKRSSKTPQKHHGGKRKREQQSESGSDDEEYEPPEKVLRKLDNPSSSRRYACLWFKRYPRKHFACGQFSFAKISHVTQHLRRTHREAVCYCPICGDNFQASTDRDVHIRAQECQRRDFEFDTIPADRWDVIDDISRRNSRTSDQKWNDIYKTLFGEASSPPDPWYIDPYKEAARMFERLISVNTPRILNALEASSGSDSMCAVNRPTTEAVSVFRTVLCETVTDHLASEEEPPSRPSSMPVPYVPSASQAEALAQDSIWSTGENVSAISSQLQRAGVQTSALATGRVEELHGLDHQTIRMNPMQYNDVVTQESIAPLFNFTEYPGDFFRILNSSTPYTTGTP